MREAETGESDRQYAGRAAVWLGTLAGMGHWPGGPGTYGTAAGLLAGVVLGSANLGGVPGVAITLLAIVANGVGVWICSRASRELGVKDPSEIIWDEFASALWLVLALPAHCRVTPWILLATFALHRLFDISKLPPVRQCERLPGGWGIMADDWMASLYALAILRLGLPLVGVAW